MRRFAFFILLAALPLLSRADGEHSDKKKDKKQCQKETCRPHIHSIEEFGFMVPPPSPNQTCRDNKLYHQAIINFYQWYLNNRQAISIGLSNPAQQKDLLPPFHVSYETLHRFYNLIRKKYPDWISNLTPNIPVAPSVPVHEITPTAGTSPKTRPAAHAVQPVVDTLSAI